ncbi:MAG: NBR1-Ig-like domain-containing protein [Anaerolineales bacterium]
MPRTYFRIFCMPILVLAISACGAASGSPTNTLEAPIPPTWTDSAPTPEAALTLQESPSPDPAAIIDSTPELTIDASGADGSTPEPTGDSSGAGDPTLTPTIQASGTVVRPAGTSGPRCDDSLFVEDVTIPDGTVLKPGDLFNKTWRFKNTGTCSWTTSYAIGYAYGAVMHGSETKLPKSVSPGYTVDITVKFTAPAVNCWYGSWWRLKNARGDYFGDFVFVSVIVSNGMENGTPYPTMCVG